jgi:N-acetylglucosamine-6-phosphate deacetylase
VPDTFQGVEAMKAVINGRLIIGDKIIDNKLLLFDDRIAAITDKAESLSGLEIIDAEGFFVSSGFIDIHIHGAYGCDVMDCSIESLSTISKGLCRHGVTSFLPTTMTMDRKTIQAALENIRRAAREGMTGARVLGAHLEGPFINPTRKGAHNERFISKADYELIKDYLDVIKIITIAPELEESMDFIKSMQEHEHISLSLGHSNATYEEALAAIEAGIRSGTHIFNAMSGLNHREPGAAGAILNSDVYCELIADNIHVHPAMYKLIVKAKGSGRLILISDSIRAAYMKQGSYELGGQTVILNKDEARLPDGTLAGSVLSLDKALRNLLNNTELTLPEAVAAVTINPARLIGVDNELGSLEVGKKADIVIFDGNINIKNVIINGSLYEGC